MHVTPPKFAKVAASYKQLRVTNVILTERINMEGRDEAQTSSTARKLEENCAGKQAEVIIKLRVAHSLLEGRERWRKNTQNI